MKAIEINLILSSVRTRVDGSLGLGFSTGEMQAQEKVALMELQNQNLKVFLQPTLEAPEALIEVKNNLGFKTPGQRLRAVLYIEWKQTQKNSDVLFQEYYEKRMDQIIERVKTNLNPE